MASHPDRPDGWIDGMRWSGAYTEFADDAYRLVQAVERTLLRLGDVWSARQLSAAPFLPIASLQRYGYLESFPHLATVPVAFDPDDLARTPRPRVDNDALALPAIRPVRHALTPASCYHVYEHCRGTDLATSQVFRISGTCFRYEAEFQPLVRQWCFTMCELVCIGAKDDVDTFIEQARARASALLQALDLACEWKPATDAFFEPARNPKLLMQRMAPNKWEAIVDGVALASINQHREHFAAANAITAGGAAAQSACLAFGIERCVHALVTRFGSSRSAWASLIDRLDAIRD
jgi:hypothetical protein